MDLTVIGSGTVSPSARRSSAAHLVEDGSVRLLMDCGPGTVHRLARHDIDWMGITHVALSHFHLDHWGDLPAFLFALRWGSESPRLESLTILAPEGIRDKLEALKSAYGEWVVSPEFPLEIVELKPGTEFELAAGTTLGCHPTPHTDESLALAVGNRDSRLVYTGDTGPSSDLADWARDCNLLLAECSLPDEREIDVHLTPRTVGELAETARTERLVLTHLYPFLDDVDVKALVARHFGGPIDCAEDGARYRVSDG